MKILIATDIHCGYGENKKYLYEDSFESFEEVLQQAQRQGADLVLLGECPGFEVDAQAATCSTRTCPAATRS